MKLINRASLVMILAAIGAWGQSASRSMASPAPGGNPRAVMATNNAMGLAQSRQGQTAIHQRIEDMGSTLTKMHAVLKQMQAKTKSSASKDPMSNANLEMWGLMLQDLDKQYEQLLAASHSRDEMEARRAALYKQAEAKAAAEAQGIQAPGFARTPVKGAAAQGAPASNSQQAAPAQPAAALPADAPASAPANSPQSPN